MRLACVLCLTALLAGCVPTADFVALRDEIRLLQAEQGRAAKQDDLRKKLEVLDAKVAGLQVTQQDLAQKLEARLRQADDSRRPQESGSGHEQKSPASAPAVAREPQSEVQAGASPQPDGPATQTAPVPTVLYNQAYNAYLKGHYDLAIAGFGDLLKKFPGSSRSAHAQYWIGRSHSNNTDYRRAIESYERVLADYPKSDKAPAVFFELGVAYAELGESAKARERLQQVIEQYPQSNEASRARLKLADLK